MRRVARSGRDAHHGNPCLAERRSRPNAASGIRCRPARTGLHGFLRRRGARARGTARGHGRGSRLRVALRDDRPAGGGPPHALPAAMSSTLSHAPRARRRWRQCAAHSGIAYSEKDYGQVAVTGSVRTDRPHGGRAYERFTNQCVARAPAGGRSIRARGPRRPRKAIASRLCRRRNSWPNCRRGSATGGVLARAATGELPAAVADDWLHCRASNGHRGQRGAGDASHRGAGAQRRPARCACAGAPARRTRGRPRRVRDARGVPGGPARDSGRGVAFGPISSVGAFADDRLVPTWGRGVALTALDLSAPARRLRHPHDPRGAFTLSGTRAIVLGGGAVGSRLRRRPPRAARRCACSRAGLPRPSADPDPYDARVFALSPGTRAFLDAIGAAAPVRSHRRGAAHGRGDDGSSRLDFAPTDGRPWRGSSKATGFRARWRNRPPRTARSP